MINQTALIFRYLALALATFIPPLLVFTLARPPAAAAAAPNAPGKGSTACQIVVKNPAAGARVGRKVMVEGTAILPPGTSLWAFVGVDGLAGFWPQGGGPARLIDGRFRILSYIGRPEDIGTQFVVHLAIVDEQTNQILRGWVRDSNVKRSFDPIDAFPSVVDGCPIRELKVVKASDN
jgi:hypothetical protein